MQPQLIAGRYQVLRAIGRGGMGTVWLCRDEVLGRQVAVKQIRALAGESANETKRAMREARSAAALNHPNAVAVFDVVTHDGRPWLVMEYVDGQTLDDEISRYGQLSPRRVADIGAQLASALARAHERGIVHRDIKPANVLIDKAGRPKISDFGIARGQGDDQLTAIGFVTGTPGYLSPELARGGDPHPASDVWALGASLYAAVEGQSPYEPRSNPIALLRAIASERPRPMTHAGVLGPAIEAMMHDDPSRRWDMATSAKRLGRIARLDATVVMPRVAPAATAVRPLVATGTAVMPVIATGTAVMPVVEHAGTEVTAAPVVSTQRMEAAAAPEVVSTQRMEAVSPPVVSTQRMEAVSPPVVSTQRFEAATAPVAEPAMAARPEPAGRGTPRGGAPVSPPDDRGSDRRRLALAFAAMIVAAFGMAFLLSQLGDQGGTTAVLGTSATAPAKTTATRAPAVSEPPAVNDREHKNLEDFVTSYYSNVTKHRDRTWDQLTPRMQNAAGGRDGYDAFWKTIDKVEVNQTRLTASEQRAVVSLTFTRKDGSRSTETHQFTFVTDGRDYLIDSDRFVG
jgi:predicted Ser/Thr protein kinase